MRPRACEVKSGGGGVLTSKTKSGRRRYASVQVDVGILLDEYSKHEGRMGSALEQLASVPGG